MAVHNGLPYLREAIDSILHQTFSDFKFLIVDDGSSDGSTDFLKAYRDPRMRIISNKKQRGLSRSLNDGLDESRGEYVARMDHDDLSLPSRLAKQSAYLDMHPEIDLVGTWARTMGPKPEQIWKYPLSDGEIRSEFLFNSVLIHGSVMLRRSSFDRLGLRYDPKVKRAQDYELWTRAAPKIRFANMGDVLLRYRIHVDQIGERYGKEQQDAAAVVRTRELKKLGLRPSTAELRLHNEVSSWLFPASGAELQGIQKWFLKLRGANNISKHYPMDGFDKVLEQYWWAACRSNVNMGLEAWRLYSKSPLAQQGKRGISERANFWIKCLLRELGWKRSARSKGPNKS